MTPTEYEEWLKVANAGGSLERAYSAHTAKFWHCFPLWSLICPTCRQFGRAMQRNLYLQRRLWEGD